MPRILAIESATQQDSSVAATLATNGFAVDIARSGREGIAMVMAAEYDAIALERWLPDLDGVKVITTLRGVGINTPVIMTSMTAEVSERVEGLRAGCDDYISRPFSEDEMSARVEALLRRKPLSCRAQPVLQLGYLTYDLVRQEVKCWDTVIKLRPTERRVLEFLLRHAGQVLTRAEILEAVWGAPYEPGTNLVDVHIGRLRAAIEVPGESCPIRTVRGIGYILRDMSPRCVNTDAA